MSAPTIESEAPPAPATEASPTILVLEDNELVRRLTVRMLGASGYRIREAATTEDALAAIASADLLLSDLAIAGEMVGADLARAALRAQACLKVVLVTGHAPETLVSAGVDISGFEVLYKPYTKQQLLGAVRRALEEESSAPQEPGKARQS